MDRGERRHRTLRHAQRERQFWLGFGYPARPLGEFRKMRALGCSCRRSARGRPKIPAGLCHLNCSYGGYHASTWERIQGNRTARAWLQALRGGQDGLDVEW